MLRDWRIASLGAVVAVTAAALVLTQVVGTSAPEPSAPATVAGDLDLSSPAAALNRAADYLERQEVPSEPRPDQWIYLREVDAQQAQQWEELPEEIRKKIPMAYSPERWVPYDDKAAENDESDTDYRTARESYRIAAALPEDPEALLARLREVFPAGSGPDGPPKPRTGTPSAPCRPAGVVPDPAGRAGPDLPGDGHGGGREGDRPPDPGRLRPRGHRRDP
ncbi:hypothetical protein SMICM17S_04514 [Streptomyces microflavus]